MSPHPFTILIRMPNWLGDCVMALPALRHVHRTLPEARIFLAGRPAFRDLLAAQDGVAGYVEAPARGLGSLLGSLWRGRAGLADTPLAGGVDAGLLFTNSLSTAAWMWRLGVRNRVGYNTDARRLFLTHSLPCGSVERSLHFINYYLWLAQSLEALVREHGETVWRETEPLSDFMVPRLAVPDTATTAARSLLRQHNVDGRYAVFAPASAYGPVKDWPVAHYRALAARFNLEYGLPVVVTGGAGQAEVCQEVVNGIVKGVNLAGKTDLPTFAGLIAGASVFVGGDSGGAHVAAALAVPTLVIFGITNPSRTRATGARVKLIGSGEDKDVKLSNAAVREAARLALENISPDEVFEEAREWLS